MSSINGSNAILQLVPPYNHYGFMLPELANLAKIVRTNLEEGVPPPAVLNSSRD